MNDMERHWYKVRAKDNFYDDMVGYLVETTDKTMILEFKFTERLGGIQRVAFYKDQLVLEGKF